MTPMPAPAALAAELLNAAAGRRTLAPLSDRYSGFDLDAAYRVAAEVRALRIARGERPVGRKIGFTNRTIWAEYGVWAPIWGDVYDSTLHALPAEGATADLGAMAEPRIEPEIVFGLAAPVTAGMDEAALLGAIGWVAHGFEIVQSLFPGWRFTAADTVAAFGLHGGLWVGPRTVLTDDLRGPWRERLAGFEIDLHCDGRLIDHGLAGNVLGSPLLALQHLQQWLAAHPQQPALAAGEVITTGTLTRAFPVAPGQVWQTALQGIDLPGARLQMK